MVRRRYFLAADLVRAYLQRDPRAEGIEALLQEREKGALEVWISGLALIAGFHDGDGRIGSQTRDRLARLLTLSSMIPAGGKTLSVALAKRSSNTLVEIEDAVISTLPFVTVLTLEQESWKQRKRSVMGPEGIWDDPTSGRIPLVDLTAQLASIYDEVQEAMSRILLFSSFILGEEVRLFEEEFAVCCGVRHAVAVNSGTDALHLALRAMGIGKGDGVLTVSHTFAATAEAVCMVGAYPFFVDINPNDYCMLPDAVVDFLRHRGVREGGIYRDRVTGVQLKALLPVHLYGQVAEMERLLSLAQEYKLSVIEDAAQAHGAALRINGQWRRAGSLGDAGAFSFYPGKNLGAWGDAGAFVTHRDSLAAHVRKLRDHGRVQKYRHELLGWSSRLDSLQAAILRVKLRHLHQWTEARRKAAGRYSRLLRGLPGLIGPLERPGAYHVYHLYVVRLLASIRESAQDHLRKAGIETGIHYPIPVHLQPAFGPFLHGQDSLKTTETVADEVLSLPLYPEIAEADQERVASALRKVLVAQS